MSGKSNLIHKGIECRFSEGAETIVSTEESKVELIDKFFDYEPIGTIKWVTIEELIDAMQKPNYKLPMYSISNGENTLLFWPMLDNGDLHLFIESIDERPELKDDLDTLPCDECGGGGYGIYGQPSDTPCQKCNP